VRTPNDDSSHLPLTSSPSAEQANETGLEDRHRGKQQRQHRGDDVGRGAAFTAPTGTRTPSQAIRNWWGLAPSDRIATTPSPSDREKRTARLSRGIGHPATVVAGRQARCGRLEVSTPMCTEKVRAASAIQSAPLRWQQLVGPVGRASPSSEPSTSLSAGIRDEEPKTENDCVGKDPPPTLPRCGTPLFNRTRPAEMAPDPSACCGRAV